LTYSEGYDFRVCLDISLTAVLEARKRIDQHGLYVIADVANLPFKIDVFDGLVSLHTLHHLPIEDQIKSYEEFFRVLAPEGSAVVVNGWTNSTLMWMSMPLIVSMERIEGLIMKLLGRRHHNKSQEITETHLSSPSSEPKGTFVEKLNVRSLQYELSKKMNYKIFCWRSVSVRFLRAVIHSSLGGKYLLRLLFWMEEKLPGFFGEKGQYPLVVIWKS
ncbi:MAG: class I SAM-dependent methyltransferase, partial [Anaerolineaceae bacterium]|nr:class I SAM-dependent methyltransferase [Anaerolineaceae bacterium]